MLKFGLVIGLSWLEIFHSLLFAKVSEVKILSKEVTTQCNVKSLYAFRPQDGHLHYYWMYSVVLYVLHNCNTFGYYTWLTIMI